MAPSFSVPRRAFGSVGRLEEPEPVDLESFSRLLLVEIGRIRVDMDMGL